MFKQFKKIFAHIALTALIAVPVFSVVSALSITTASAETKDNQIYKVNYENVFADAIFSEGDGTSAVNLSWGKLAGYPNSDDGKTTNPYGDDSSTTKPSNQSGASVASFLHTMQKYNAYVAVNPSNNNTLSGFFYTALKVVGSVFQGVGKAASVAIQNLNWITAVIQDGLLFLQMFGQGFYQMGQGITDWLNSVFKSLNLPVLLGFSDGDGGYFGTIFQNIRTSLNITPKMFTIIRGAILGLLITAFLIIAMVEIGAHSFTRFDNIRKHGSGLGIRIFTMIGAIPITLAIVALSVHIAPKITSLRTNIESSEKNNTFLNVQDWAIGLNFDRSILSNAKLNGTVVDGGKDFLVSMSMDEINQMTSDVNSAVALSGVNTVDDTVGGKATLNDWVNAYNQQKTFNVQDYISGVYNLHKKGIATAAQDDSEYKAFEAGTISGMGDPRTPIANIGTYWISMNPSSSDSSSIPYTAKRIHSEDLATYIMGAVSKYTNAESTKDNYIGTSNTIQDLGDLTLNSKSDSGNTQMMGSQGTTSFKDAKADDNNALRVSARNAFQGGNATRFTNQSMVFLLSSGMNNDGINFSPTAPPTSSFNNKYTANPLGENSAWAALTVPATTSAQASFNVSKIQNDIAIAGFLIMAGLWGLFKAPLIGAAGKAGKNFLSAQFTGDFIGLIRCATYTVAFPLSLFSFALAVIGLTRLITGMVGGIFSPLMGGLNVPVLGDTVANLINLVSLLVAVFAGCYPYINMPGKKGNMVRTSAMGALVNVPFLIADSLSDMLISYEHITGFRGRTGRSFGNGLGQKIKVNNPKDVVADDVKNGVETTAKVATAVGAAVATGGTTAALQAGATVAGALGNGDDDEMQPQSGSTLPLNPLGEEEKVPDNSENSLNENPDVNVDVPDESVGEDDKEGVIVEPAVESADDEDNGVIIENPDEVGGDNLQTSQSGSSLEDESETGRFEDENGAETGRFDGDVINDNQDTDDTNEGGFGNITGRMRDFTSAEGIGAIATSLADRLDKSKKTDRMLQKGEHGELREEAQTISSKYAPFLKAAGIDPKDLTAENFGGRVGQALQRSIEDAQDKINALSAKKNLTNKEAHDLTEARRMLTNASVRQISLTADVARIKDIDAKLSRPDLNDLQRIIHQGKEAAKGNNPTNNGGQGVINSVKKRDNTPENGTTDKWLKEMAMRMERMEHLEKQQYNEQKRHRKD